MQIWEGKARLPGLGGVPGKRMRQRGCKRSVAVLYRVFRWTVNLLPVVLHLFVRFGCILRVRWFNRHLQIDVKFAPAVCIVPDAKGKKFYRYTAMDKCSRFRCSEAFEEHRTYSWLSSLSPWLKLFHSKQSAFRRITVSSLLSGSVVAYLCVRPHCQPASITLIVAQIIYTNRTYRHAI